MKWYQYLIILAMVVLLTLGIAGIVIALGDPETTNVPSLSETVPAACAVTR